MELTAGRIIGFVVLFITLILGLYIIFVENIPGTLVIPDEFRWLGGIILIFSSIYIAYVIWPDSSEDYYIEYNNF